MNDRERYETVLRAVRSIGRSPYSIATSASWSDRRDWQAGLTADDEGLTVYYGPGSMRVDTPEEAARVLKGIFADDIVCVTALQNETPVYYGLAPHNDPTASFNQHDGPSMRGMPAIDHVMVRSWTGKRDRE